MSDQCKQISLQKPDPQSKETVFSFIIPIPEVPTHGARIKVACAGVCYTRKGSLAEEIRSPSAPGIRDTSLFPGYEVAGTIDALGNKVDSSLNLKNDDKVVVYPYDELPALKTGIAEFIPVPDAKYLVKVPPSLPLSVAAMLPTGALWALNAVQIVTALVKELHDTSKLKVIIVGTGGLALWTLNIAKHFLSDYKDILLVIAALRDDKISMIQKYHKNVVSWNENVYESHLLERTKLACDGEVDICLDYSASPNRFSRTVKCLSKNGIILVGPDCKHLESQFYEDIKAKNAKLHVVGKGSLEQLQELVNLVAEGKIVYPKYSVYPVESASEVLLDLSKGKIEGRAVIEFSKD